MKATDYYTYSIDIDKKKVKHYQNKAAQLANLQKYGWQHKIKDDYIKTTQRNYDKKKSIFMMRSSTAKRTMIDNKYQKEDTEKARAKKFLKEKKKEIQIYSKDLTNFLSDTYEFSNVNKKLNKQTRLDLEEQTKIIQTRHDQHLKKIQKVFDHSAKTTNKGMVQWNDQFCKYIYEPEKPFLNEKSLQVEKIFKYEQPNQLQRKTQKVSTQFGHVSQKSHDSMSHIAESMHNHNLNSENNEEQLQEFQGKLQELRIAKLQEQFTASIKRFRNHEMKTFLEFSIKYGYVDKLINFQDKLKRTPLHWACLKNNFPAVIMLLQVGANTYIQDSDQMSPKEYAIQKDYYDMTKYIDKHNENTRFQQI